MKDKWKEYRVLGVFSILFIVFAVIVVIVFLKSQDWTLSWFADTIQWGQYGDFIGGVFGVFVVLVSTYYLVETLREQKDANLKVTDANTQIVNMTYLQQIDTKYKHLMFQYDKIKQSTDTLSQKLKKIGFFEFHTDTNYGDRNSQAQKLFEVYYYIPDRRMIAVRFRLLYHLFKVIDNLDETTYKAHKVLYAKLIRSQLDEEELLSIRYNCYCSYGENMRQYVNKYNLLKHLPILSLLEFKYWSENIFQDDSLLNAIDTEFLKQKIFITAYVTNIEEQGSIETDISSKYKLMIYLNKEKTKFIYILNYNYDNESNYKETIDEALDKLLENNYMLDFLEDFLHELFEYSNFNSYNANIDFNTKCENDKNKKITKYIIELSSNTPLILTYKDPLQKALTNDIHPFPEK